MKKTINIADAPKPVGPYNQAVLSNGMLFISGQIPLDPYTGKLSSGDIREKTKLVMDNIGKILAEAGMNFSNVVKCTLYVADLDAFKEINEVYANYFTENAPARETIQAAKIPLGAELEISAIATV